MFFEQQTIELNKIKFNVDNFDINVMEYCLEVCYLHYDIKHPDYNIPYNQEVEAATQYLKQLGEALFYQKHDSKLIKELLLWYTEQDWDSRSSFTGYITMFLKSTINYFIIKLNFYRLGFVRPTLFRSDVHFSFVRGELDIKGEQGFKQFLIDLTAQYKEQYLCDEADSRCFEELLNYDWPSWVYEDCNFSKKPKK